MRRAAARVPIFAPTSEIERRLPPRAAGIAIRDCANPRTMAGIPKDKLEKMVGRWNAIQAELNAGVNQAVYAKLTKEFAALSPLVATIEALNAVPTGSRADLKALIDDPTSDKEMVADGARRSGGAGAAPRGAGAATENSAAAQGCRRRAQRHSRSARRHRRRRGGAVRGRPVPHVQPLRRAARLEGGDHLDLGERPRRLQGDRRLDHRRRRVRAAEVRIRRASRAARPGDRDGRAHPHVGGDGRRAARGRGGRRRHPARRTSASTPCAPAAPAASTSTRRTRPCA